MLHLLSIEILKLHKNRQFLILMIVMTLSVIGLNYIISDLFEKVQIFNIPAWNGVAFINGFIFTIPAMIIIMHTCSEYTYRTNRQNIIDGLTRKQYVTIKLAMVVALALFTTISVFTSAAVCGIFSGVSFSFEIVKYIVYYFIQASAYLVFAFFLALYLKRSILALSIFVAYSMIIDNYLCFNLGYFGDLLPLSSCDFLILPPKLLQIPFYRDIIKPVPVYLTVTFAYSAALCAACFYRYEKQDL